MPWRKMSGKSAEGQQAALDAKHAAEQKAYAKARAEEDAERIPYDFKVYRMGLYTCSVCTSLTDDAATQKLNRERPSGCSSPWQLSSAEQLAGGKPNGGRCPHDKKRRHIAYEC
jgi:hypothetical protein